MFIIRTTPKTSLHLYTVQGFSFTLNYKSLWIASIVKTVLSFLVGSCYNEIAQSRLISIFSCQRAIQIGKVIFTGTYKRYAMPCVGVIRLFRLQVLLLRSHTRYRLCLCTHNRYTLFSPPIQLFKILQGFLLGRLLPLLYLMALLYSLNRVQSIDKTHKYTPHKMYILYIANRVYRDIIDLYTYIQS